MAIMIIDGKHPRYKNGQLHRTDGPAVIKPNGHQAWYLDGKRHREDGPAYIGPDGYQEWYLNHTKCSPTDWCNKLQLSDLDKLYYTVTYGSSD